MANRNYTTEKEQARKLYLTGITSPTMIATVTGVPRQTVGEWIRKENWDATRQTANVTPMEIAQEITQILRTMLKQVKELKDDNVEISPLTIKEMIFWTKALRQLDEDYDVRGSLIQFANKFITFVSSLPQDILPDRKNFVKALQIALPLFIKAQAEA